jgi:5-oxoprolinase (ATP-hydrolysing)
MGGTSTDVSVYYPESGVEVCYESYIGGINVHNPCFDINTVAAGGGSLLTFLNGMFRVGPESSGAIPGPV